MFYTICYISNDDEQLKAAAIERLFSSVSEFNNSHNISGLLLHGMGHFFQILEGEKEIVEKLFYEKILNDPRHSNIFVVIEKEYDSAIFSAYSSKFNTLKTSADVKKLFTYLEGFKYSPKNNKIKRLMQPFVIGME